MDTGNFTSAAEFLGVPRSTLSTMVAGLENRLGARLFHRTTRVVTPTEEGLRLAERARSVIDEANQLETMFKQGEAVSGRVRLSMPGRIAHQIVIPALSQLLDDNPDLLLDLRISDKHLDLVSEGLDLVLRVGLLEDSNLICRRLGELPFINCASPDYLKRWGKPSAVGEVTDHRAVSYGPPEAGGWVGLQFGGQIVKLKASMVVDSTEGYIRSGLEGLGIISLPRFDVQDHLSGRALVEVLPECPPRGADMALLYPSRKHLALRIEVVRDWLIELTQGHILNG